MTGTRILSTDRVLFPMSDSLSARTDDLLPGQIQQLLEANQQQLVLAESCTAGLAAARLGSVPGISAHFCGSAVVYQEGTKQDWLDLPADLLADHGAVSEPVALQMAARALGQTGAATLAVSITGHLGPAAPAQLDGQVFVGMALEQSPDPVPALAVIGRQLEPAGRDDRQRMAADLLLQTTRRVLQVLSACRQLEQGEDRSLVAAAGDADSQSQLVFPGAFNPLHEGHREMMRVAEQMTGIPVVLEISLENVDKPDLSAAAAVTRVVPLSDHMTWITRAATFAQKAELFPGSIFVTGADTIARIGQQRYYEQGLSCEQAIEKIAENNCRFLVFGRVMDTDLQTDHGGEFHGLDDLEIPDRLREICDVVSQEQFRRDISSRQLRESPRDE